MKAKKNWILTLVALVSCGIFWGTVIVWANGVPEILEKYKQDKRSSLQGLQGVELFVMGPQAEIEKYGLTKRQIRTDVELKLRQAGVKVLSTKERYKTPGAPLLTVFALVHKWPESEVFSVDVRVGLTQSVVLARDRSISCKATTWETFPVGAVIAAKDLQSIRRVVKDYVNEFINDYLAANTKKKPDKKGLIEGRPKNLDELINYNSSSSK